MTMRSSFRWAWLLLAYLSLGLGFIGIFLGPTFLALGQALFSHWTETRPDRTAIDLDDEAQDTPPIHP